MKINTANTVVLALSFLSAEGAALATKRRFRKPSDAIPRGEAHSLLAEPSRKLQEDDSASPSFPELLLAGPSSAEAPLLNEGEFYCYDLINHFPNAEVVPCSTFCLMYYGFDPFYPSEFPLCLPGPCAKLDPESGEILNSVGEMGASPLKDVFPRPWVTVGCTPEDSWSRPIDFEQFDFACNQFVPFSPGYNTTEFQTCGSSPTYETFPELEEEPTQDPEQDSSSGHPCEFSRFAAPLSVPSESCCVRIQAWLGFGQDADSALHTIGLICDDQDETEAGISCADAAKEIYEVTPPGFRASYVEPNCGTSDAEVVDFSCLSGPTSHNVPGGECCSLIQAWLSPSVSDSNPIQILSGICGLEDQVITSTGQSCRDAAEAVTQAAFPVLNLNPPRCEISVHVMETHFGEIGFQLTSDGMNHKCLEGLVRRELFEETWMSSGSCSDSGFGLLVPELDPITIVESEFHFYTDQIVAHTLDSTGTTCSEARLLEPIIADSELPDNMHIGGCISQGYERPQGLQQSPFGDLYLFGPGINLPPSRAVHIIDHPVNGKCGEKTVLLDEMDAIIKEQGYQTGACARSNYFVRVGTEEDFSVWALPPSEPQVLEYNWDFRTWTVDYFRGTVGGASRPTPLDIPASQRKNALLYGGSSPGPLVEAIEEDTIRVQLSNEAVFGESTTIHWHGLHMRDTPFADGTQLISQLPLGPHERMEYKFKADPAGTYFYHSHIPFQRALGAQGPILIHSRNDPHRSLYDEDRIVFIADQVREPRMVCEGLIDDYPVAIGPGTRTYTPCNIFGAKHSFNGEVGNGTSSYPYHLIPVEEGKCYRMRFVLASTESVYVVVELAGHTTTIIAVDGTAIVPKEVEQFHLHQGARVDAVVCADASPGMYGLTATDQLSCGWKNLDLTDTCSFHAFLSYDTFRGPPPTSPPAPEGPIPGVGGGRNATTKTNGVILDLDTAESYRSVTPLQDSSVDLSKEPHRVTLEFGLLGDEYKSPSQTLNTAYRWFLSENKTTFHYPANGGVPLMRDPSCYDPHETPIVEIPEDAVEVEVVINNLTPVSHSLHIHGMRAKVINAGHYEWADTVDQFGFHFNDTQDRCGSSGGTIEISDPLFEHTENGQVYWGCAYNEDIHGESNNYETPLERDVFNLPRRAWLVLRFTADSPGIWPIHCHISDHAMGGAVTAFSVLSSKIPDAPEEYGPKRHCLLRDQTLASEDDDGSAAVLVRGDAIVALTSVVLVWFFV